MSRFVLYTCCSARGVEHDPGRGPTDHDVCTVRMAQVLAFVYFDLLLLLTNGVTPVGDG